VLGDELGQMQGAGKAGRAAADEHDAGFHGVSLDHHRYLSFFEDVRTPKNGRLLRHENRHVR
jgi:hypothetical protein